MSHDDIFNSRYGPRIARGGIKAQGQRGDFGKNWWAKRWISVIESLELGGRLARGRNYARRGQVLSISVESGLVKAKVQGSEFTPYDVAIRVKTIAEESWLQLAQTGFNRAIVAAKLLAQEMPTDIESVFSENGLSLFPRDIRDFETGCSCPDYSNPCKHIASVYYLLGEEFDRDPFLIFTLRGMPKERVLSLITMTDDAAPDVSAKVLTRASADASAGALADASANASVDASSSAPTISPRAHAQGKVPESSLREPRGAEKRIDPVTLSRYYQTIPVDGVIGAVEVPQVAASLPKSLGNMSFWRSSYPFLPTLEQIYKAASQSAVLALSEESS